MFEKLNGLGPLAPGNYNQGQKVERLRPVL